MNSTASSSFSSFMKCQVCGQPAHGHHFGAVTCRACAAFFRRCHFSKVDISRCRHLQERCSPDSDGKWSCKKCRLTRCLALGMNTKNIQYDRDAFSSSESFVKNRNLCSVLNQRVPTTIESVLGIPHLVCFLKKEPSSLNQELTFVDISKLVDRASQILQFEFPPVNGRFESNLEELALGLREYRAPQQEFLSDGSKITKEHTVQGWETAILSVAKWVNYSEDIRKLPHNMKLELLQCSWLIWIKLERAAMTAEMRVNQQCGKRQVVVSHDSLLDFDEMDADISFWSNHSFEELRFMFTPDDTFYDKIIWEIIEVQPDPIELTFLLCNLCFGLAGKTMQGELAEVTDRLQETLANDLHNHYLKNKKPIYAHRLQQLMRINEHFLKQRSRRKERYHLCSILNMFKSHFSNSEFFRVSC